MDVQAPAMVVEEGVQMHVEVVVVFVDRVAVAVALILHINKISS